MPGIVVYPWAPNSRPICMLWPPTRYYSYIWRLWGLEQERQESRIHTHIYIYIYIHMYIHAYSYICVHICIYAQLLHEQEGGYGRQLHGAGVRKLVVVVGLSHQLNFVFHGGWRISLQQCPKCSIDTSRPRSMPSSITCCKYSYGT